MKPILFNTEMVNAILEGRKTTTRRLAKPQPIDCRGEHREMTVGECAWKPPCYAGDILYVRETWQFLPCVDCPEAGRGCSVQPTQHEDSEMVAEGCYIFKADCLEPSRVCWHPSIHMPKEAARLFLLVTGVRMERLQKISIGDIKREGIYIRNSVCKCAWAVPGCQDAPCHNRDAYKYFSLAKPFGELWDSTIKPTDRDAYGWDANPWVWVIEFERCEKPKEE